MDIKLFQFVVCANAYKNSLYLSKIRSAVETSFFTYESCSIWIRCLFSFFDEHMKLPNFTEMLLRCNNDDEKSKLEKLKEVIETRFNEEYDFEELVKNTEKFCQEQSVLSAITKIVEDRSQDGRLSPSEILDIMNKACNVHIVDDIGFDYIDRIDDFCAEITKPNLTISTGFKWLDDMLGGGWSADGRALYVFAGQTNVGKSIFLGQFAVQAYLQNKTVLLISLEMSETMYARRITSNLMKIGMNELPNKIDEIKRKGLEYKNKNNGRLIIKEYPTSSVNCTKIYNYIEDIKRKGVNPDIVIVDYLNLLLPGRKSNNSYDSGKICSEELRALSCHFKIPFVTATQLNRSGFGREDPSIETTSESIGTSFTCDAQISIFRTDEHREMGMVGIGMQKSRFGPNSGSILLSIDYPHMTISEIDDDTSNIVVPEISNVSQSRVNSSVMEVFNF